MAEDFAGGEQLVVVLGDNIFEYSHAAEIAAWGASDSGAQVFVKDVPDPENFGVVVYDDAGARRSTWPRRRASSTCATRRPPRTTRWSGSTAIRPDVFSVIASLERSSRGELEITDVNRAYAQRGALSVVPVRGWWEDAGKHWQHLAEIGRTIDETGVNK